MALPDNPLTRGEQYLNRIATGEGTIPDEPLTRIEQYLDYIAENGGSGGGGSGGGVFVVGVTLGEGQTLTCDKTAEEIYDAFEAGQVVRFEFPLDGGVLKSLLLQAVVSGTTYVFIFMFETITVVCTANSGSAYPSGTLSEP